MKLNPYPLLLSTGALMFVTVVLAQTGGSLYLVKKGARAMDQDIYSLTVRVVNSPVPMAQAQPGTAPSATNTQDMQPGLGRWVALKNERLASR
jgi:hypothetical protein